MTYWFPAKRYGWGWGWPATWQGWVVMVAFFLFVGTGLFLFPPNTNVVGLVAYLLVLSAVLIAICWLKGEPPRWRWGK